MDETMTVRGGQHPAARPESRRAPSLDAMRDQFTYAQTLVDDIVLKKYLYQLTQMRVVPLDESLKRVEDIRLYRISRMVYQKDEYSTYKFATVFSAVQHLNGNVFVLVNSDGRKTDFYIGAHATDGQNTSAAPLGETLINALRGQFPGVVVENMVEDDIQTLLRLSGKSDRPVMPIVVTNSIASVSCAAAAKDEDIKSDEGFLQGLEKLANAMQGRAYTAIILARNTPAEQVDEIRHAYESIYTNLSPFANTQVSYSTNTAQSSSIALSQGKSVGTTHSEGTTDSQGRNWGKTTTTSSSKTKPSMLGTIGKALGQAAIGIAGIAAAPLTGGASIAVAAGLQAVQAGLNMYQPGSKTTGTSTSFSEGGSEAHSKTVQDGTQETESSQKTDTKGITTGTSDSLQLTVQNKTLLDTLERIDRQLERLDECESLGMWECAAYFLADRQETAQMAAGTYKAIMKGVRSGVETSAINVWGKRAKELPQLQEYIQYFVHPVFSYDDEDDPMLVTAASLISSNELAIQMGLPRRSVCGFPVVEHADFGKEVVRYGKADRGLRLGTVYNMGVPTATPVKLDIQSLTMHTFITGSTGSGKSNTVCHMLSSLPADVRFLVIEPAKGEYKTVLGQREGVYVYGTNPHLTPLLRIDPFSFPKGIHIYEHMDRLVEIFNVCWPMYAAMPAVLKDAIERAYTAAGWDLENSVNRYGYDLFPNFADVLEQIETVIEQSQYSSDSKGDYKGALCTRLRSLTNGINRLIFTSGELTAQELFDKNVIVDLSRVGSNETKSLIMGLLVMKLQEYRMASVGGMDQPLRHMTVLEEAHNLLKMTSTEQNSESANLLGKSVEMLTNAIAEMRTYGEGFIIADQSPELLDRAAIRNTNTKIIMRLPAYADRELVGRSAGLNDAQIQELSRLDRGVAAVYQNSWIEAVLCKVDKFTLPEVGQNRNAQPPCADMDGEAQKRELLCVLVADELPGYLEVHDRQVIDGPLPTAAKCAVLDYMNGNLDARTAERRALYALLRGEELFERTGDVDDSSAWLASVKKELGAPIDAFSEEDIRFILMLLILEYGERHPDRRNHVCELAERGGVI